MPAAGACVLSSHLISSHQGRVGRSGGSDRQRQAETGEEASGTALGVDALDGIRRAVVGHALRVLAEHEARLDHVQRRCHRRREACFAPRRVSLTLHTLSAGRARRRARARLAPPDWEDEINPRPSVRLPRAMPVLCQAACHQHPPSPTLSPTDPVPRGLLTLCPGAQRGRGRRVRERRGERGGRGGEDRQRRSRTATTAWR